MTPVWEMSGRFLIEGKDEDECQRASEALERAAKRVNATVTIHIHVSEPQLELAGPEQPSAKEREAYRNAAPLDNGEGDT